MGLLDLPLSALSWIDAGLAAVLPAAIRIALWGGIGAMVSMGLYWLVSPQRRIAGIAAEERRLKDTLRDENTEATDGLASARSEEHTSELQSPMRISYAVFCLKKKTTIHH